MDLVMVFAILACLFGFVMAWGIGANDLANIMSTALGSKAITVRQAVVVAILFEFAGAFFGGGHVTNTIRSGIINIGSLKHDPQLLVYGMLAVLLAGSVWMLIASFLGLPVSITNAIVGSLVGFTCIVLGVDAVHWSMVSMIALSWLSAPVMAGITAYILFRIIQYSVLSVKDPHISARRVMPFFLFVVGIILSFMVIVKGLNHFNFQLRIFWQLVLALGSGVIIAILGWWYIQFIKISENSGLREQLSYVEKLFAVLMALTSCAMVFAHGSNDVAIAVGPMAAVVGYAREGFFVTKQQVLPGGLVFLACCGVVLGLFMYGRKVIETVGSGITALTPSRAFAATIAAATTVVILTGTGIPVSATQTLVGAVFGVGLARGIDALNLEVIRNILLSWIITLPAASLLAIAFYSFFKAIF